MSPAGWLSGRKPVAQVCRQQRYESRDSSSKLQVASTPTPSAMPRSLGGGSNASSRQLDHASVRPGLLVSTIFLLIGEQVQKYHPGQTQVRQSRTSDLPHLTRCEGTRDLVDMVRPAGLLRPGAVNRQRGGLFCYRSGILRMLIGFYPADLVIVKSKAASRIEEALPNLDI